MPIMIKLEMIVLFGVFSVKKEYLFLNFGNNEKKIIFIILLTIYILTTFENE